MSYELIVRKKESPVLLNELIDAIGMIHKNIPFINCEKSGFNMYNVDIDEITKCYIDYLQEEGQVQVSANSNLAIYVDAFGGLLSEALHATLFDPQNMKEVSIDLQKIDLNKLRPSEEEKENAKKHDYQSYVFKAWKMLGQIQIGLLDFENDKRIPSRLLTNSYGPIFIPHIYRNDPHEIYTLIKKGFKDKYGIDINERDFLVVRVEHKYLGSVPYVVFKKPK